METIIETIRSRGWFEFSWQGRTYLIQTEHNKGWDYLSLWRTAPGYTCMGRVFLDGSDGVSAETMQDLFDRSFPEKHMVREIIQEIQMKR